MKVNLALRAFSGAITALTWLGVIATLLGAITLFANRGEQATDIAGATLSILLIYVGSSLVGLAVFGSFLRISAKAIIEGLGGNTLIEVSTPARVFGQPAGGIVVGPKTSLSEVAQEAILETLYAYQRKDWQAVGSPDLAEWDELGRPDFDAWLVSKNSQQ